MRIPADDTTRTPLAHATVAIPGDATGSLVTLVPLSPHAGPCKAIRWLGAGPATLWYVPATPRPATGYTASEAAVPVPNARGALRASYFAQGEERIIQAVAIDTDSTAGSWEVTF